MDVQLDLIDLDQELPGQRHFISCWVGRSESFSFLVDPGPPSTVEHLMARLELLGLDRVDHVLLTHIHLDHGGATAQILARWPAARVHCHPKARVHLIDPGRLWEGSRQVLGRKAEVYGQPQPVPASALVTADAEIPEGLQIIPTPGHAPHHVSFLYAGNLFVGEAAGTFSSLGQGPTSTDYYLRPATPPRFFLPVATASLARLRALDPVPERICFAHHGEHTAVVPGLLRDAHQQLELWVSTLAHWLQAEKAGIVPEAGPRLEAILPSLAQALREADPLFAKGARLPEDIREREDDFTGQTLRGMLGFLAESGSEMDFSPGR